MMLEVISSPGTLTSWGMSYPPPVFHSLFVIQPRLTLDHVLVFRHTFAACLHVLVLIGAQS